jgi:hypothetical protein
LVIVRYCRGFCSAKCYMVLQVGEVSNHRRTLKMSKPMRSWLTIVSPYIIDKSYP